MDISATNDRAEAMLVASPRFLPTHSYGENEVARGDDTPEWRAVPGYPHYEASSGGEIRSLPRATTRGGIAKQWIAKGYLVVDLCENGIRYRRYVHQLVLDAFGFVRPVGSEARHLDGKSLNCRLSNLAWGTHSENEKDKVLHGTHRMARRTHCNSGHELTPENIYRLKANAGRYCLACKTERESKTGLHGRDKTHCKRGHIFDVGNTHVTKTGARVCRICNRDAMRARRGSLSCQE